MFCHDDVANVLLHVRAEDEDGAVHPGQEERGGGQPLSGTGGREAEGVPALSQHRVPGGLGHGGVVTGIFLGTFYTFMANEINCIVDFTLIEFLVNGYLTSRL